MDAAISGQAPRRPSAVGPSTRLADPPTLALPGCPRPHGEPSRHPTMLGCRAPSSDGPPSGNSGGERSRAPLLPDTQNGDAATRWVETDRPALRRPFSGGAQRRQGRPLRCGPGGRPAAALDSVSAPQESAVRRAMDVPADRDAAVTISLGAQHPVDVCAHSRSRKRIRGSCATPRAYRRPPTLGAHPASVGLGREPRCRSPAPTP